MIMFDVIAHATEDTLRLRKKSPHAHIFKDMSIYQKLTQGTMKVNIIKNEKIFYPLKYIFLFFFSTRIREKKVKIGTRTRIIVLRIGARCSETIAILILYVAVLQEIPL